MSARDTLLDRDGAADCRAFYLQRAFRALLDAMARPGEVALLPEPEAAGSDAERAGLLASTLTVVDVLLGAAATFAVAGEGGAADATGTDAEEAERVIAARTHAAVRPAAACGYAFVPAGMRGDAAASFTAKLSAGTLLDPQLGATLVVECDTLLGVDAAGQSIGSVSSSASASGWELSGPGIKGTARLCCDRDDVLGARCMRGDEFPCGIDLVLVDAAGHVAAIPRTTSLKGGSSWDM